ncbi:vesicular integral-membrane protein VIP36-like isoform X1 [Homarus americanus]|uniref:vesicular integral-membrane protein VIP36-like isoform X1 n=2 Tax=Homarus americanus TaxID=6706 RepID=UPI001C44179E|nr:vesicular integral-membrane protein VIP36-like isoform X1 [Homarus americanus]
MMMLNMGLLRSALVISFFSTIYTREWNTHEYMIREHSLVKPYQGLGTSIPYWDFLGSTMVTNNYIRLTADAQSLRGAIWNKAPCYLRNWEMQIHFKVHGRGKDLFGDGFVFWYVKEPMQEGDVFGSKDFFTGLAVVMDTYSNHNGPHNHGHPYISAMVNNGTLHYDHDRDGTHTQLSSGCVSKFRNLDHDTYISIQYVHDTLTVMTDIENKQVFKECFSVAGVKLPLGYFLGVSAATGDLTDGHDIISLKMYDLSTPDDDILEDRINIMPSASFFEPPRDHVEDPKPSSLTTWKKVVLLVFGVITICGCVFIGGLFYTKQKEQQRKRFY